MKEIVTSVSIVRAGGSPVFDCIKVSIADEGAGPFLVICGEDKGNDGAKVKLCWAEWDGVVAAVERYREAWEV